METNNVCVIVVCLSVVPGDDAGRKFRPEPAAARVVCGRGQNLYNKAPARIVRHVQSVIETPDILPGRGKCEIYLEQFHSVDGCSDNVCRNMHARRRLRGKHATEPDVKRLP